MMSEVTVTMPLKLNSHLLNAVRNDELTSCVDKDEINKRIGWLVCAYDVLVKEYISNPSGISAKD